VSRGTQATAGPIYGGHIESAGKRRLQRSGKYRVNKNDEEIFGEFRNRKRKRAAHGVARSS
jgi:hypothetical protein